MSSALQESVHFLNELTRLHHRGRGDTLSAARDRAAKLAGVPRTYAKRLWDRWTTMKDVSGEAYRNLRRAYEEACQRNEEAAARYRSERLALRNPHEADLDLAASHLGMAEVPRGYRSQAEG